MSFLFCPLIKWVVLHIAVYLMSFLFLCYFQVSSITLVFSSLTMMCLDVVLFVFILFGVVWASSIFKCIYFTRLEDFQLLYIQIYTLAQSLSNEDFIYTCQTAWCSSISPLRLWRIFSLFFRLDYFYWSDGNLPDSFFFCHVQPAVKLIWWIFHFRYCNFLLVISFVIF